MFALFSVSVTSGAVPRVTAVGAGTGGVAFHLFQALNDLEISKPASPTGDWLYACTKKRGSWRSKPPGIAALTASTADFVFRLAKIARRTPVPWVRWSIIQNGHDA